MLLTRGLGLGGVVGRCLPIGRGLRAVGYQLRDRREHCEPGSCGGAVGAGRRGGRGRGPGATAGRIGRPRAMLPGAGGQEREQGRAGAGAHAVDDVPSAGARASGGRAPQVAVAPRRPSTTRVRASSCTSGGPTRSWLGLTARCSAGCTTKKKICPHSFMIESKRGSLLGSNPSPSVTIKMETPVTYFYSPAPLLVNVRVDFPKGVLTQWYPGVTAFLPPLAAANSVTVRECPPCSRIQRSIRASRSSAKCVV